MNYLIFKKKVNVKATSKNADLIESVEIKGGLHVISEALYLENKDVISGEIETREVLTSEWIISIE